VTSLACGAPVLSLYDGSMKTSMKVLVGALALVAVIGSAGVANAGFKSILHPVFVDLSTRNAGGTMSDARNSADSVQFMTVSTWAMSTVSNATATFMDANGVLGSCTTTEPRMIAALQSVKSDSYVRIVWNSQGQCTQVLHYTSSADTVKQP
jgi:hypothetical protein